MKTSRAVVKPRKVSQRKCEKLKIVLKKQSDKDFSKQKQLVGSLISVKLVGSKGNGKFPYSEASDLDEDDAKSIRTTDENKK